jgi:hypothetical protein
MVGCAPLCLPEKLVFSRSDPRISSSFAAANVCGRERILSDRGRGWLRTVCGASGRVGELFPPTVDS